MCVKNYIPSSADTKSALRVLTFTVLIGSASCIINGNSIAQEIFIRRQGMNLAIEWSLPGRLQSSDTLSGPWAESPSATSPYLLPPAAATRFYRLRLLPALEAGEPAYSLWPDGSVSLAVPIGNEADRSLANVEVLSVGLQNGSLLDPQAFPVALGDINPESFGVLRARFSGPATNGTPYLFTATGQYRYGNATNAFSIERSISFIPPAIGPFTSNIPQAPIKWTIRSAETNGLFGPAKPEATEVEFAEAAPLPLGPDVQVFPRSSAQTETTNAAVAAGESFVNLSRDTVSSNSPTGIPPDPNAAADSRLTNSSGVVLITYNSRIGVSINNGQDFTIYDPKTIVDPSDSSRTTIFPEDDGGFCCDQSVIYLPAANLFLWVLQYWPQVSTGVGTATSNRIRVAWATPNECCERLYKRVVLAGSHQLPPRDRNRLV